MEFAQAGEPGPGQYNTGRSPLGVASGKLPRGPRLQAVTVFLKHMAVTHDLYGRFTSPSSAR
jgi:hypothetical protein